MKICQVTNKSALVAAKITLLGGGKAKVVTLFILEKVLRAFNVNNSFIDGDTILCISCAQFSIKDPIHQKNQLLSSKVVR